MKPLKEQTNSELINTVILLKDFDCWEEGYNGYETRANEARQELESRLNTPKMECKDIKDTPI